MKRILRKRVLPALLLFVTGECAMAQTTHFSESYNEVKRQQAMKDYPIEKWDSLRCAWFGECLPVVKTPALLQQNACTLNKRMFGWHSIGSSNSSYQWSLLSDLSYFSYQVDPATGEAINTALMLNWGNDATVIAAKANGVKVSLCVTLFNNGTEFNAFFNSATAPATLVTRLVEHAVSAGANGINIDFEGAGLNTTYLSQFIGFMNNLRSQLNTAKPGTEISIDLQGSFANSSSLLNQLAPSVDLFILMGYDYYWGSQNYPGPIAPTYQFPAAAGDPYGHGNVANDVNNLLKYVPANKVLLGMPYYGRRWRTTSGCTIPATGSAASLSVQTYSQFRQNSNGYYSNTLRDNYTFNAYHCFNDVNAIANQQFIDDTISLQRKYDIILQRGLAGAAVWRLSYDAGYADCWNLVNQHLTQCAVSVPQQVLYDMGGPLGNYHNAEKYTFTVAPAGADFLNLVFSTFELEQGFDSLRLYNGATVDAPLIGAYTGAAVPAAMVASSGKVTIQFKSDNATTKAGYALQYAAAFGQLVFRSISSGSWHNAAIWSTGTVPCALDSVIIGAGHVVELNSNGNARKLDVETGGELRVRNTSVTLMLGQKE